jgi:hypothetical protein
MPRRDDTFNSWIEKFPYDDLIAELNDLQQQVQALNARLFALQDLKQMYERIRAFQPAQDGASISREPGSTATSAAPPAAKPSLREAVRTVMASDPDRDWKSDQLWEDLTTKGWLRRDKQGRANMFAMLSTMTQQGQLERAGRGVYRLKVSIPETPG